MNMNSDHNSSRPDNRCFLGRSESPKDREAPERVSREAEDSSSLSNGKVSTKSSSSCQSSTMQVITRRFAQQNLHEIPALRLIDVPAKDREESLYEIHGVRFLAPEDQDLLQEQTNALMDDLRKVSWHNEGEGSSIHPFEWVLHNAHDFMRDQAVKCLRAEGYDIEKAASCIRSHFELKYELFGQSCLGRELQLQDLGPEERRLLEEGGMQFLPARDRSGRGICLCSGAVTNGYPEECKVGGQEGVCAAGR